MKIQLIKIRFALALCMSVALAATMLHHSESGETDLAGISVPIEAAAVGVAEGARMASGIGKFLPGSFK